MLKRFGFIKRVGSAGSRARLLGIVLAVGSLSGCYLDYRDSNVQRFGPGEAVALNGKQLYFTQSRWSFDDTIASNDSKLTPIWGVPPYYYRAVTEQTAFFVDPSGHESVDFSVSDPFYIPGSNSGSVPSLFSGTYIGSDGTVSFMDPGLGNGNLTEFFSTPQVSLLPFDATVAGARVTYGVLPNMLVVTYENVSGSSVQCILVAGTTEEQSIPGTGTLNFDDIIITYRNVSENTRAGVVGISWAYLKEAPPEYIAGFLADFDQFYGGEVELAESTNTESGGYVTALPLP